MSHDIQEYTLINHSTIPDANSLKQNNQIHPTTINCSKRQMGLHNDYLTTNQKNHHLLMHDLYIDQAVMYQDATTKKWYPAKE